MIMTSYHGVARIYQSASSEYRRLYPSQYFSAAFLGLEVCDTLQESLAANVSVVELPIGSLCVVLPSVPGDFGWTAILYEDDGVAVMGWIHPEVWVPCQLDLPVVTVHHIYERGCKGPSLFFDGGRVPSGPGIHELPGKYPGQMDSVMNCIWRGSGRHGATRHCSGHCASVVAGYACDAHRMGVVLSFAVSPRTSIVFCKRAKHRSVSVGNILSIIAGRRIEWRYATRVWCRSCCGDPIVDHPEPLYAALRGLPVNSIMTRSLLHACICWL